MISERSSLEWQCLSAVPYDVPDVIESVCAVRDVNETFVQFNSDAFANSGPYVLQERATLSLP